MSRSDAATDNERILGWVQEYKNGGDSSEVGLASSLYKGCLRTLGSLSKQYSKSRKSSRERKARLVESHARLCLFGDGLLDEGALEHCLKVDSVLREAVIRLLYRLGKTLLRAAETLYHVYDPVRTKEELILGLADLLEIASVVLSHQDEPGDGAPSLSDNSEGEENENECEITALNEDDDVLGAFDTYTTCLMDLRPILEQSLSDISKPVPRRTGVLPIKFQVTEAARPYVLQVHDKFRAAKAALVERLGEANWQRYIRLKTMAAAGEEQPENTIRETALSEVPKSAFYPISQFHDSGLGSSLLTRTRYATSNASHTSFLSTDTDASKERSRVPSTPIEVGEGKAFTCSICTKKLSGIKNRVDWKLHVFADLSAYICTFLDCPDFLITYPTRKLWAEHEFTVHRSYQQYECHSCSRVFINESTFVDHISHEHDSKDLNHTQLLATISAAKRSVLNPLEDEECPLCYKTSWTLQRDFVTHVGRHLEEIALASLPREEDSESGAGSETDTSVSDSATPRFGSNLTPQITRRIILQSLTDHNTSLQAQGKFNGWQSSVQIELRALQVELLIASLRVTLPVADYDQAINVALTFEAKAFSQEPTREKYTATMTEKLSRIQDTRALQVQRASDQQEPSEEIASRRSGPTQAKTPLSMRRDHNGVQWIAFEYSRDRVKMEYTIRCDVESISTKDLSQEFRSENCVYPRACVPKEQYKGTRWNYETECNEVGWSLAKLNPCLRSKRGLIQRAVDSWRNSNQDPRLRTRRVRRMNTKSKTAEGRAADHENVLAKALRPSKEGEELRRHQPGD